MTEQSILQALDSDHAAIAELLDRLQAAAPGFAEDGRDLREELVIEAVRHFVGEEQYLHPLLRTELPDGADLAAAGFAANRATEAVLRRFEQAEQDPAEVLAELRRLLAEHVAEQQQIFDRLAAAVPAAELDRLGTEVRGAEQLAPTRPRTLAASNPALNKFSSFVEGFLDHVRDSYGHRGAREEHVE